MGLLSKNKKLVVWLGTCKTIARCIRLTAVRALPNLENHLVVAMEAQVSTRQEGLLPPLSHALDMSVSELCLLNLLSVTWNFLSGSHVIHGNL